MPESYRHHISAKQSISQVL